MPTCWSRPRRRLLVLLLQLVSMQEALLRRTCASSAVFDLREHLSTKAPYAHRVSIRAAPSLHDTPDAPGYAPVFLYLLARHGSRWPTEKRMRQINGLQHLFRAAASPAHPWMRRWTSPVAQLHDLAGELHPTGEAEMMGLARRLRHRFPNVTAELYAPRRYPVISTQVPRAAQSASAFALGFFGSSSSSSQLAGEQLPWQQQQQLGAWVPHSVAVQMLPKTADPVLRPFDCCSGYREHEARAVRWLAPWMQHHWASVARRLEPRMGLPAGALSTCDVDALWQLCTLEAGLLGRATGSSSSSGGSSSDSSSSSSSGSSSKGSSSSSGVCGLLEPADVRLLEWLEDVRLYETQGHAAPVNYEIAAPLLADARASLIAAAAAHGSGGGSSSSAPRQRARLMFAHCETLTPLASLLGLFRPAGREAAAMPVLPPPHVLAQQVVLAPGQADDDVAAADGVLDDLLLEVQQPEGEQQQQTQQQQGPPSKRRRLTSVDDSSSSGGSNSASSSSGSSSGSSSASSSNSASSSSSNGARAPHAHGPGARGCSYKGSLLPGADLLPPPPGWAPGFEADDADRAWRGGRVAPLGANLLLVLYARESSSSSSSSMSGRGGSASSAAAVPPGDFLVRLVYNEQVVPLPGCGDALDCSLQQFVENVVGDKASAAHFKRHCSGSSDSGSSSNRGGGAGWLESGWAQHTAGGGLRLTGADGQTLELHADELGEE